MGKYKYILPIIFFILILNSCFNTQAPNDIPATEEEITQIIEDSNPEYGDPALYTVDEKYFIENGFIVDFESHDYVITKTFSNNNIVVCLNPPGYLRAYVMDGSEYESDGYKGSGDLNLVLTDKNGNCLTEIYYNSIKYINPQYLECQLNLQDYYIHQFHPDKFITDIVDFNTGKVIKRFLNGGFSYYSEDLSHLNIYSDYYSKEGNYYTADDPVIIDWLLQKEREYEEWGYHVANIETHYSKQEYLKRGYTDKDFNIIIPPVYDEIYPFDEKWQAFSVLTDGKYFIIDRGNNRLSEKYDGIFFTWDKDMPIAAFKNGKFCILDRNDYIEIVPPTYDLMDGFREGYAPVIVGDEEFYIDVTGKRVDISEVPENLFLRNNSALFEPDINKKIKKYLGHMGYYIRGDINFITTAENIFEDPFYNYVPALLNVPSANEIAPEIIVRREMAYRFALDESYFTPEKRNRMAIYGYYRPVTNDFIFPAYGLHPSYIIRYIVLDIEEKGGELYDVKVLPVIIESEEGFSNPKSYFFGINHTDHTDETNEKYFLDELIPEFAYNHELLDKDPELDILKQAYLKSPEKYKTLTMAFKITKGGLINLIRIN